MAGLPRDFLEQLAQPLIDVYTSIEDELIQNIAKRFNTGKGLTTQEWQLKKLAELGGLTQDNIKTIAKYVGQVPELVQTALESAAFQALKELEPQFAEAVRLGYLNPTDTPLMSESVKQAISNYAKQALDDFNLVNTTMLNSSLDAYRKGIANTVSAATYDSAQKTMNVAAGEVVTGVKSRQKALSDAIKKMANEGITAFYDRAGRKWSPEAYVNMDIRTTATNTAHATTFAKCDDYGLDLIEISSHAGARPKCANDQGKLFSRSNKSGTVRDGNGQSITYYPWSSSSNGAPDGILGINCGHFASPFFPGLSYKRSEETQDFEKNAKEYAQSQQQRALERDVREAKREAMAQKAAGNQEAYEEAAAALKAKQDKYKSFCSDTGRTPRNDRLQVNGYDRRTAADVAKTNREAAERLKREAAGGLTKEPEKPIIKTDKVKDAYGAERARAVGEQVANAPPIFGEVWNKYADNIGFDSTTYRGTAHYSPASGKVSLNLERDALGTAHKPAYETTFHELGHLFDHSAGASGYGSRFLAASGKYSGGIFSSTLKAEAEAYTKAVQERLRAEAVAKGLKASSVLIGDARRAIRSEIWELAKTHGAIATGDISDIFEGATRGKITGTAGHGASYWSSHDVSVEAFAEMFSASICNPASLAQIQRFFPQSYNIFLQILKSMI